MRPEIVGFITFLLLGVSAVVGVRLRRKLPGHHFDTDARETVRTAMALVSVMAALVLGLLVASTKEAYDTKRAEVTQMASRIILLSHLLQDYGPDAAPASEALRHATRSALQNLWPSESDASAADPSEAWDAMLTSVYRLAPKDDAQSTLKAQAARIATELGQVRWLLYAQAETSFAHPMLVVVVAWLAILFLSIGVFAPVNSTVMTAILLAAISAGGAIYLILELDLPFGGLIHISSASLRSALLHILQ